MSTRRAPHTRRPHTPSEREHMWAIEEELLTALAAGQRPPLADYLARFPALREEIVAFLVERLGDAPTGEEATSALDQRTPLSPGMRAALDTIAARSEPTHTTRVAEDAASYTARTTTRHASERDGEENAHKRQPDVPPHPKR